jgi:hypothetical protein
MENLNNTDKTSENTEKEFDVIPRFSNLSEDHRKGIHEVLFQMDILELEDDDKVEEYYNQLPNDIKKDGVRWGFQDSVVRDTMCVWFEKNVV